MDDDFDRALEAALDDAEEALNNGKYKQSLKVLLSLSMSQIRSAVPTASYAEYSKLISVVEQASAKNVAQADLVNNIKALGKRVVSIAKLVPDLASIL